jgi:dihydropteroate synthase
MKIPRSVQVVLYRDTPSRREYLALLRRHAGSDDFWQPVSGSLEAGETPFEAARREVWEETGLSHVDDLREIGLVDRFEIAPAWLPKYDAGVTHNLQYAFAARVAEDAAFEIRLDPREHVASEWAPYDEVRALYRYAENRRALEIVERREERSRRRRYDWPLERRTLELGERTLVMGILNVTPDSFSDGGRFFDPATAVARALEIEAEGADILDIGGESSRPGALPIDDAEQIRRVVPVVEALAAKLAIPISIDTTRGATARAALEAGAEIVNDISALRFDPRLAEIVANHAAGLVLMHMRGTPETMQKLEPSPDIFEEVERDLLAAMNAAEAAGVETRRIVLDPGIGFGKTLEQNVALVANAPRVARLDRPLLYGTSRKSFLGKLTGRGAGERRVASVASAVAAVLRGAHIVRAHDVRDTVDAVRVADAVLESIRQTEES